MRAASPIDPHNLSGGPSGLFPIAATHAFGPRGPGNTTFHDGNCHQICRRAIIAICNEVGLGPSQFWTPEIQAHVKAWQQHAHDTGTTGIEITGVVHKVTWDTMVRR